MKVISTNETKKILNETCGEEKKRETSIGI